MLDDYIDVAFKRGEKMTDFTKFKPGDWVFDVRNGWIKIERSDCAGLYQVSVMGSDGIWVTYTPDGKRVNDDVLPSLYDHDPIHGSLPPGQKELEFLNEDKKPLKDLTGGQIKMLLRAHSQGICQLYDKVACSWRDKGPNLFAPTSVYRTKPKPKPKPKPEIDWGKAMRNGAFGLDCYFSNVPLSRDASPKKGGLVGYFHITKNEFVMHDGSVWGYCEPKRWGDIKEEWLK